MSRIHPEWSDSHLPDHYVAVDLLLRREPDEEEDEDDEEDEGESEEDDGETDEGYSE